MEKTIDLCCHCLASIALPLQSQVAVGKVTFLKKRKIESQKIVESYIYASTKLGLFEKKIMKFT